MSYCTGKHIEKSRGIAMKMLVIEKKPVNVIAEYFGFKFKMVQSDNGPEFSKYFSDRLEKRGIQIRHTRLGGPNNNAHIERFNRTIQEECTGNYYLESGPLKKMDNKVLSYVDFLASPGNFYNFSSSETSKVAERVRAGNLIYRRRNASKNQMYLIFRADARWTTSSRGED